MYSEYILKENLNVFYQSSEKSSEKAWNASFILSECVRPGKFRMYLRTLWVLEKKSHILSRDARICVMVSFSIQWFMSSHYVGFYRHKETNLVENKQTAEWKILIHGVMLSLWKTSKIQNIMFPLIFAMLLLDSKLLYSLSCEEYVNLFFWIFHISNSIWLICFCSKNGTCCYLHKWDIEQGKCIRK